MHERQPVSVTRARRRLLVVLVVCCLLAAGYLSWKRGTPYQTPFWSPNKQYFVQKYSNLSLRRFAVFMPGQGSDAIDGYIRLYDRSGKLLHERFATFIRDIEPVWHHREVFLSGVEEMDDHPWILPGSSD